MTDYDCIFTGTVCGDHFPTMVTSGYRWWWCSGIVMTVNTARHEGSSSTERADLCRWCGPPRARCWGSLWGRTCSASPAHPRLPASSRTSHHQKYSWRKTELKGGSVKCDLDWSCKNWMKHPHIDPEAHAPSAHSGRNTFSFTWWLVCFFTVKEGDVVHGNNSPPSGVELRCFFICAAKPNLRRQKL